MNNFILLVVGIIIGLLFRFKQREKLDNDAKKQNLEIHHQLEVNRNEMQYQEQRIADLSSQSELIDKENKIKLDNFNQEYQQKMQLVEENSEQYKKLIQQRYLDDIEKYKQEYLKILGDSAKDYRIKTAATQEKMDFLFKQLNEVQAKTNAVIAESKRREEMAQKNNFYRINITKEEQDEIEHIRSIECFLRDASPLNKVIYKTYYERPLNDMIGRVVGSENKIGIYKITSLATGKCYIGQTNQGFKERWRTHVKCALGASNAPNNKLYPTMAQEGVENFTFEVLEVCSQEELDEREDFYQQFYQATIFGLSLK